MNRISTSKDMNRMLDRLVREGLIVELQPATRGGHPKAVLANGHKVALPGTPSGQELVRHQLEATIRRTARIAIGVPMKTTGA